MSAPGRIYLEPDHNQIEGRMWCQDDDPASLGEPWTEYVRADIHAMLALNRDEWMVKANKATALASQYLRERDRYREALGLILTHATEYNTDVIEIAKKALYREE
jgi:hypothetical protein